MLSDTQQKLESLISNASLPHGVLLCGPDASILLELARSCSRILLKEEQIDRHPDFVSVEAERVEDVRRILGAASLRSYGKRVFILQNAQNLTAQAVNNLLKVIEEPKEGTYFFVLTNHEESLLPTLRSRLMSFQVDVGQGQAGEVESRFLEAPDRSRRLQSVSGIDSHDYDVSQFLSNIYYAESSNMSERSGHRFQLIMDCFKYLSSNVNASRVLSFLALRW